MINHIINEKAEEPYRHSSYWCDASKAIEFALIHEGCAIEFMKFLALVFNVLISR